MEQNTSENILGTILSAWKDNPEQGFNITQLAMRVGLNRRELKGALEVLSELGILESMLWKKTRKQFRFNSSFTYNRLLDRVHQAIPAQQRGGSLQYKEVEWKKAIDPLIRALLPPDRLRWYIENLWDYTSKHAFARTIFTEGYDPKLSPELSHLEREYLAMKLEELMMYGPFQFGIPFVLKYFQEFLDEQMKYEINAQKGLEGDLK